MGSLHLSGKPPTYPSPNPTLTPISHLGQNVGLGEGKVDSFPMLQFCFILMVLPVPGSQMVGMTCKARVRHAKI